MKPGKYEMLHKQLPSARLGQTSLRQANNKMAPGRNAVLPPTNETPDSGQTSPRNFKLTSLTLLVYKFLSNFVVQSWCPYTMRQVSGTHGWVAHITGQETGLTGVDVRQPLKNLPWTSSVPPTPPTTAATFTLIWIRSSRDVSVANICYLLP